MHGWEGRRGTEYPPLQEDLVQPGPWMQRWGQGKMRWNWARMNSAPLGGPWEAMEGHQQWGKMGLDKDSLQLWAAGGS